MRVYGFHVESNTPPGMKSTATYTRSPARTSNTYQKVAREAIPASGPESFGTIHRVAPGDNLTQIVRDFLRAQGRTPSNSTIYEGVRSVAQQNRLRDADLIHPGQDLNLSVLLERSTSALSFSKPLPGIVDSPAAPLPTPDSEKSIPVDRLRDAALTHRAMPLKIHISALAPPSSAPESLADHTHQPPGTPKTTEAAGSDVSTLQQLLDGTSNSLAMLQKLLGEEPAPLPDTAPKKPWESVLRGSARLSSDYGMRKDPFTGRLTFHDGIDIAAKRGTEITALRDGEVVYSGWKGGYGNTVIVRHKDGFESVYGHTSQNLVSLGETVQAGSVLAKVGSTGRSTGPHLHLEVRRHGKSVNPLPHLTERPLQLAQSDPGS